MDPTIGQTT